MIERGDALRFTLEARAALGVRRGRFWENLDRDQTIQFRVAGAIDLPHSTCADGKLDLIRPESSACSRIHFFKAAVQFKISVIGVGASSTTVRIRKRWPSGLTTYCCRRPPPRTAPPGMRVRNSARAGPGSSVLLSDDTRSGTAIRPSS